MNCPTCGAPIHLLDGRESATCEYCKAVYLPEQNSEGIRVFDQTSDLACPVCKLPLVHAAVAHHRIFYCPHCRGTLVPMPVFVLLIQDLRARQGGTEIAPPPDPGELERHIWCPRCGARMDTHYYGGGGNVVIDDCSRCELNWLDSGELMSIGRAPDHFRTTEPQTEP